MAILTHSMLQRLLRFARNDKRIIIVTTEMASINPLIPQSWGIFKAGGKDHS